METTPFLDPSLIVNRGRFGCGEGYHFPCVTTSGWIHKYFWVRCWEQGCNLKIGPFDTRVEAVEAMVYLDKLPLLKIADG